MTINHIRYFIVTAEYLSFTKASERLFISQPSLSRQITAMETELNQLLFIRHKNHTIELTPSGVILLEYFKNIYNTYSEAVALTQRVAYNITGELKIGVLSGIYTGNFLPPVIKNIDLQYPNVHVTINNYSLGELNSLVQNKKLDLIFSLYFSVKGLTGINSVVLDKSKDFIAINKTHHLASIEDLKLEHFEGERFFTLSDKDSELSMTLIRDFFHNKGIHPMFETTEDARSLELWVEAGYGVTIVTPYSAMKFMPDIRMFEIDAPWKPYLTISWREDNKNAMIPIIVEMLKQQKISP